MSKIYPVEIVTTGTGEILIRQGTGFDDDNADTVVLSIVQVDVVVKLLQEARNKADGELP